MSQEEAEVITSFINEIFYIHPSIITLKKGHFRVKNHITIHLPMYFRIY